jgi:hypothetical protein
MALVDLKTDLKSLKFESGLNRKPFVVKDIDQEGGRNSGLAVQGILAAKRVDDVVRMAKLVIAKPGLTYAAKTALSGLIRAADLKAEKKGAAGIGKALLEEAKDILATAVTNIAQTPLNGLGLHLYKGALNLDKDKRNYISAFSDDTLKKIQSPAHSLQKSQGIKKSKKLKIADDQSYGYIDYTVQPSNAVAESDIINASPIVTSESELKEDIIPFYFTILNGADDNIYFQFRAYLDSLSDSYSGMWNKTQYIGRPESFKTYTGFERNINFSFKVAAETRADLNPIYKKLNLLASTTAPTFDDSGLFMRGTLVKIRIGDYLHNQLCNITSIGITWQQDYQWEIKSNPDEKGVQILPHVLDVSVTAEAIHEFVPQTGPDSPFITNSELPEKERLVEKIATLTPKPLATIPTALDIKAPLYKP